LNLALNPFNHQLPNPFIMNPTTLPLLGFAAWSGTGKTTLLTQLIPLLGAEGIRVAVVKHAHHNFDIDHPGKDSYELRHAGARQVLIASRRRLALMLDNPPGQYEEPTLPDLLARLDPAYADLILVEGFKQQAFPKIELYRPALGQPLLFPTNPTVIAIATDQPDGLPANAPPILPLNEPAAIAEFIRTWLTRSAANKPSTVEEPAAR